MRLNDPSNLPKESSLKLFATTNLLFQVQRPSVRKKNGVFGTLSSMLVLPKWKIAAMQKTLCGTRQQCTYFKTVWKKTVSACVFSREEHCSTFGLGALRSCSNRILHTTTRSGCGVSGIVFSDWKAFRSTVLTKWLQYFHPWMMLRNLHDSNC